MKEILRISSTILALILGSCSPTIEEMDANLPKEIDARIHKYYAEDYSTSKAQFLSLANKIKAKKTNSEIGSINIPTKDSNSIPLTIDYLFIPGEGRSEKILIISSGIHGTEAGTGASIQRHFLTEIYDSKYWDKNTSLLVIHSLNPWGFHNIRRNTENNVDLNRNFDSTGKLFQTKNEGYTQLYNLLNPDSPADSSDLKNRFFIVRAVYNILTKGMPALRQSILQGQYEHPEGIFFGGMKNEPLRKPLDLVVKKAIGRSKKVLFIDLHTGYGERGKLHLFPSVPKNEKVRSLTESIFSEYQIDWASNDDFYSVMGDLSTHICELVPDVDDCIPMVFEYGTLNSNTTLGSIDSIHRTILENQGYWKGYSSKEEEQSIKNKYKEMFYPSSERWRSKVLTDTEELWKVVLKNF